MLELVSLRSESSVTAIETTVSDGSCVVGLCLTLFYYHSGKPVLLLVQGNATTGYVWQVDAAGSSASLQVGSFQPVQQKSTPGLVGAPKLFSLKVVPTEVGLHTLTLQYVRPWDPEDNPSVKVVNFRVI